MPGFEFAIDRGGTFTDVFARCPGGKIRVMKLLSEDPAHYVDAPREGIRRIMEEAIQMPEKLYEVVVEVDERVVLHQDSCQLHNSKKLKMVTGVTGEQLEVWQSVNLADLEGKLQGLLTAGIKSLAVVLIHSYIWAKHEEEIEKLALRLGFSHVSLSSRVAPMVRVVPRGFTACADAYLSPCIQSYLQGFRSGFKNDLKLVQVLFMQSDGGLTPMEKFIGSRAVLSGPAGGVVGLARTAYGLDGQKPVIGFDMGGTSTDVSRYAGEYEHVFEATTAGVPIQAPQLDINTVAAGGGSILFYRNGIFLVGPESAGAFPGPICYKKDTQVCFQHMAWHWRTSCMRHRSPVQCSTHRQCSHSWRSGLLHFKKAVCSSQISTQEFLNMRYERTDCALMVSARHNPRGPDSCCYGDFQQAFVDRCVCVCSFFYYIYVFILLLLLLFFNLYGPVGMGP
uniref:5-oxoprolinase, ATP-hydrolysing n=1 Tax=Eptatretus burgeri TaxID=7764 RepID=A0A8C4R9S7_EPTBU